MSDTEFPTSDVDVEAIDPETLKEDIDADEEFVLLDTRVPDEVETWAIDGGESVELVNVPYFEFLAGEPDEEVFEQLPEDEQIVAVCAKGQSSEFVAGELVERGYDANHLEDGMKGWARVYEYVELDTDEDTDLTVAQYQRPASGCLSYLVVSGEEAAVIDPLRAFADTYVQDARMLGAELTYAIDTHVHADHVSGVRELANETGTEAVVPQGSADRGIDFDAPVTTVEDGDTLALGDTDVEVLATPGHTTGMTSYRVEKTLFTGDGLFTESVARPDLEDEDAAREAAGVLYDSLQKVLELPDETTIAPAHASDCSEPAADGTYTTTLGDLTESMQVLSMDREEFIEFVVEDLPPRPANFEDIIATNLGQKAMDDEEAFEIELGPNNCAASSDAMTSD